MCPTPLPPFPRPLPLPKPTGPVSFDWKDTTKLSLLPLRTDAEEPSPPLTLILPRVGLSPHPVWMQHPRGITGQAGDSLWPGIRHGDRG